MATQTNLPTLRVNNQLALPDNEQWTNRFEIRSGSSGNIYVISQNIKGRYWGCSCPGWKAHRKCKHLDALGLPIKEKPFEVNIVKY